MSTPKARPPPPGTPEVDYEALFESLPGLHLALTREGRVEAASGAFLERVEKDRAEVVGRKLAEFLETDSSEDIALFLKRIARGPGPGELPVRFTAEPSSKARMRRLKAMPVLDASGSLRHLLATIEGGKAPRQPRSPEPVLPGDREADPSGSLESPVEEVQRSEERFRLLADSAPVLIWIGERSQGCTWFNRSWLEYVGRRMEDEIGAGWMDGLHPEDRERVRSMHGEAFAAGKPFRIEFRLRGSDSQYRWMLDHGVPIGGEGRDATGFIGSCIDIHDRKRTEEQREMLLSWERFGREEAEHSSRMKDEFLATISHELRTPLQAILGWSRLLQTGNLATEEVTQGLEIIERNARAQTRIIEDLLETSRIISGKVRLEIEDVDLGSLIEAAVDTVRPAAAAKGIALQLDLDPAARKTSGDANRLQQVFWNLLSNSIKFTPSGGRVEAALVASGRNVEIRVTDTGAGIRPEFLDHIFERFRQADSSTTRRHKGLGLGLAIVRHIVELHGGVVRAASEGEGKGSTFTVTLPRRPVQAEQYAETPPAGKSAGKPLDPGRITLRGLKLLVVDDEADALEIVRRVLEKHEAQVATADSTSRALEIFPGYKPDALISDIGMPERDGYDLLRTIRSLSPEMGGKVPALALTALTRSEDRQRAFSAGYQMHISKPVEPAELVSAVAKLAGLRARRN